ncbi:ketoacyl-ACP synthase III [Paenibacillus sp. FSL R7-0337]|uniref:ketoacyl-ACP synthase III n=1 Tax=Paenibacillus sp. FSL R7-0337 TaxID=1926588 RepID=UPI00096C00B8|nr:ketoacyl-ACP synthase III [Paenibacillus sp. FSL R7-0337]OMF96837.1 3-oxoacyl-ACP synthase [Paenibacillus sp. FSL R7-0337]
MVVIKGIEYYLPKQIELNDREDKLTAKIGIRQRHIANKDEYASDMGVAAANMLFEKNDINRTDVDYLIYCTQSLEYYLPTTACILQDKLGLSTSIGALDINLGCSGYVYGLSLAKALIETGQAQNVLFITADTYSKFINNQDRSVKLLFGDGATATLLSADSNKYGLQSFVFGTDGSGMNNLIVPAGGLRNPISESNKREETDSFGNVRSNTNLYMNGPEIFNFSLKEVPKSINNLMEKEGTTIEEYDYFIFHQANQFMLEHLRKKLRIEREKFSIQVDDCGNTVSSSIPIALKRELINGKIRKGDRIMMVGFGVGYSWAASSIVWHE